MNDKLEAQFRSLLLDVWQDVQDPAVVWQLGAIAAAIALAWFASRAVLRLTPATMPARWHFGAGGLKRILFPLIATLLVLVAREALEPFKQVNVMSLAASLIGSLVIVRVVVYTLRYIFAPSGVLATFERVIGIVVWSAVALHILGVLPDVIKILNGIALPVGTAKLSLWLVMQAMFWVTATILVALWLGSAIETRLMAADTLHSNLRVALSRMAKAVLVVVAIVVALPVVGIDLTVLSVFGGALGVGIGFGLQKIASNYMSGFILLLERSVRIGDMVTADGFYGEVKDITTRYVVVRALDGREAIIPNELLITSKVLNHTHTDKRIAQTLALQIGYRSDVDRAIAIVEQAAATHARVLTEPPARAFVTGFADSGISIELIFWIGDPDQGTYGVRSDLAREILAAFGAEGIEIPYPQREVRVIHDTAAGAARAGADLG